MARIRKVSLQQRLKRAMKQGELRVQDLARWFERPYPTVWGWVDGHEPVWDEGLERLLGQLEWCVAKRLLPTERMCAALRRAHLKQLRKTRQPSRAPI